MTEVGRLLREVNQESGCQNNKQYHMKVLLNSFHLNGHTLGFHPQTKN